MSLKLLRVPMVAQVLDVPQARIYELIRQGTLPAVKLGRQVRVSEEALQEFVRGGGQALPGGWRRETQ